MDFKLKGRTWAGNIYQKFEAMCQEVDDIVRQDKVEYVGHHMQNVGESVKKLYSDAVHDLFPPSVNPVKHETQAVTLKPNAVTGTYLESMISIEENTEDIDFKQSIVELNANDIAKKQLVHASSDLHFANEPITVPSLDSIEQEESDLPLREKGKFSTYENSDARIGKTSSEEPFPVEDPQLLSSVEKRGREGPLCSEFSNENRESALGIFTKASSASPVHDDGFRSPQNEETMPNDIVDELDLDPDVLCILPSSGLESSVIISGNENSEMGCSSSICSLSTESCKESATSTVNSSEKTCENGNRNDAEMCGSSNLNTFSLSESLQIVSCENEVADMRVASSCSILSLESNGRLDESADDLADPCMETIELDDEVKLGESCVIVDSDVLHAFSRRSGRLRSYKKLIQDAFASKRRIAKEYEQLTIWYGDVDTDTRSSQHSSLEILPSFHPSTSSDLKKIPGQDSHDSEWELL